MALLLALPTPEGVVVTNDTSLRIGQSWDRQGMVYALNSRIVWSAVGEYSLIQRVYHALLGYQDSALPLRELASSLGNIIKTTVRDLLAVDFRTEVYIGNFQALGQLHRADFVFVEWADSPLILHLNVFGSPTWVHDRPFAVGNGDMLIGYYLQRYRAMPLTLSTATTLSYRLMEDAIECGMFGLQGPVDLWQVSAQGPRQLTSQELKKIGDVVRTIREDEMAAFEHHLAATVHH